MVWKILQVSTQCELHAGLSYAQFYRTRLASRVTTLHLSLNTRTPWGWLRAVVETRSSISVNQILVQLHCNKIAIFVFTMAIQPPQWARAPSFTRFLDQIQRHTTVGRTPLDEWSARRRDLYLTTHNTHKRQTYMPPGGIRTHNPSKRAAADQSLRPRGQWDRLMKLVYNGKNGLQAML
jgi:hypothetical protein